MKNALTKLLALILQWVAVALHGIAMRRDGTAWRVNMASHGDATRLLSRDARRDKLRRLKRLNKRGVARVA